MQTQKWYQSKIVKMSLALIAGAMTFFGISYGVLNSEDLQRAQTVYPEIVRSVELMKAGQAVAGLLALGQALVVYFRVFSTTKIIPQSLPKSGK